MGDWTSDGWAPLPGEEVSIGFDRQTVQDRELDRHELGDRTAAHLQDDTWDED